MKVLLADDHPLVREGLKATLRLLDPDLEVIEAANLEQALAEISRHGDLGLAILDLRMPGMGNGAGLERVRAARPDLPAVIVSASQDERDIAQALGRGASGYIPKSLSSGDTIAALRRILAGDVFDPRAGTPSLLTPELAPEGRFEDLSPRERHVLALLSEGCSNKEIARRLSLQEVTVKAHLKQVFRKLDVTSRTQAVKLVLQSAWNR